MSRFKTSRLLLAAALGLGLSATVAAQEYPEMDAGRHMAGHGPAMMGGGYGPMMGGYGPMMGYGMGMMGGMGMMPCPMLGGVQGGAGYGIELNEEQREQMNKIREQLWRQQQTIMGEMQADRQEMMRLYQEGQPKGKQLLQAYEQMQQRQRKLFEARLEAHEAMNKLLTEEQRQQLQQMHQQMLRGWQ